MYICHFGTYNNISMYKTQEKCLKAHHELLDMVQGNQMWEKIFEIHVKI